MIMKNFNIFILGLFSLVLSTNISVATEPLCNKAEIDNFEQRIENCKIDYSENMSTAGMNNATYQATDCITDIAHEIFKKYYTKDEKETRETFDNLVALIYDNSHNIMQGSDMAEYVRRGTMYNTMAISKAHNIIKNIVIDYIKEIRFECEDVEG